MPQCFVYFRSVRLVSYFLLLMLQEWEEKLNQANDRTETFKSKYERLKETTRGEHYMEQARSFVRGAAANGGLAFDNEEHDMSAMYSIKTTPSKTGSVASFGSGLAQQAKTLVSTMNNFNCTALNERTGSTMEDELVDADMQQRRHPHFGNGSAVNRGRSTSASRKSSRSFREYSKSPQRV